MENKQNDYILKLNWEKVSDTNSGTSLQHDIIFLQKLFTTDNQQLALEVFLQV